MSELSRHEKRKINTQRRHENVKAMISDLYDRQRMRFDDVIMIIGEKFGYSERTIKNILKQ